MFPDTAAIWEGDAQRLSLIVFDYALGGHVEVTDAVWSSSDTTVASVSQLGVVRSLKVGVTTVTARKGDRSASSRINVAVLESPFTRIDVGTIYACGVTAAGTIYCWGGGYSSPRGGMYRAMPTDGRRFVAVSAGVSHACALTDGGAAYCWGQNLFGQLGIAAISSEWQMTPAPVVGGLSFVELAAGYIHTCGRTAAGQVFCWGANESGQLGNGLPASGFSPVPIATDVPFTAIAAGASHNCATTTDGIVYCWGGNGAGQLGDGTFGHRIVPTPVATNRRFITVDAGGGVGISLGSPVDESLTCAAAEDADVYCWGAGQPSPDAASRVAFQHDVRIQEVTVGDAHACGRTAAGVIYCWGELLGVGPRSWESAVVVPGEQSFASVSAGSRTTCGLTVSNVAYCWGANGGLLGNELGGPSPVPVRLPGQR